MEKKLKEALIGYLNNVTEIYSLYTQDSWSDEDFVTGAVTDWTLDIMEECINDKDVVPVLKLIRKVITEGTRISEVPDPDYYGLESEEVCDKLREEAERLKARIEHPEPLKVEAGRYDISYTITGRGEVDIDLEENEEVADLLEIYLLDSGMNLDDREVTITGIKKA